MLKHAFIWILCTSFKSVDLNNYLDVATKTKTLIHYQSSSSMTERLKQNTFKTLNFS